MSVFPGDARQHRGRDEAGVNRSRKSKALRIAKGELWVERQGGATAASSRAGHAATLRQPDARKQAAADSVDVVEQDTTYPVPSVKVTAQEHGMNAPPNIDPVTAHSDRDVLHWLTNDTRDERFIDNIFAELCVRLQFALGG